MLLRHQIRFIYPFRHCLAVGSDPRANTDTARRLRRLRERWSPWTRVLNDEDLCWSVDDSYFFQPVLRALLYPETALQACHGLEVKEQATCIREFAKERLDEYAARLHPHSVLRLRLCDQEQEILTSVVKQQPGWRIEGKAPFCWDAAIRAIHAWIFPNGIGFLDLELVLMSGVVAADDLRDFLETARWIHPKNYRDNPPGWQPPQTRCGLTDARTLLDYLTDGLTSETQGLHGSFCDYVKDKRPRARYTSSEEGQRAAIFRYFLYACVNAEPDTDVLGLSGTTTESILYELANPQARRSHPDYTPHSKAVKRFQRKNHIALWSCWEGAATADAVVLLGTRSEGFATSSLPIVTFADYFPAYVLTRYQHERLIDLAKGVQQSSHRLRENRGKALTVWNDFLIFRNRYWFVEAATTTQGNFLYHRFQKACGLPETFNSLSSELAEIREHYEQADERQTAKALAVLTLAGLPATLALALFSLDSTLLSKWGRSGLVLAFFGFLVVTLALYRGRRFGEWLHELSSKFSDDQ